MRKITVLRKFTITDSSYDNFSKREVISVKDGVDYKSGGFISAKDGVAFVKSQTFLTKKVIYNSFPKRGMLSGRSMHVARAAYHALSALTNDSVIKEVTKNNQKPLIKSVVETALESDKGIPQHKNAIWTAMTNTKFDVVPFYEEFSNQTGFNNLKIMPASTDLRSTKEFPALFELLNNFDTIKEVQVNSDTIAGNFIGQKQSNHDFWVTLKAKEFVKKAIGIPSVCRQHDEKGGMAMIENTTKGHIGILAYDENGENIQMTRSPITLSNLTNFHNNRLKRLKLVMKIDGCDTHFEKDLDHAHQIFQKANPKNVNSFIETNQKIQDFLWENIHSDPEFKRSVSFIFFNNLSSSSYIMDEKFISFERHFCSLLHDRLYDLSNLSDRKKVLRALLLAYYENVDPQIFRKLDHLHYNGIVILNPHFLQDVVNYMKSSLGL